MGKPGGQFLLVGERQIIHGAQSLGMFRAQTRDTHDEILTYDPKPLS